MRFDLARLFKPKSIAVVGGGVWCRPVRTVVVVLRHSARAPRTDPDRGPQHVAPARRWVDDRVVGCGSGARSG